MESLPRWLRHRPWLRDVLLAALVALPPAIHDRDGWRPVWIQVTVYCGLVLPLLWRRSRPVLVAAAVTAAFWAQYLGHVWGHELGRGTVAVAAVLYTLVVRERRRAAAVTALSAGGCVLLWVPEWLRTYPVTGGGPSVWQTPVTIVLFLAAAWVFAEYLRARRAYLAELARRIDLAESRRLALAHAAVAAERTRIAREIHDVLAHSVSVMVVNAEGGRLARHTDPEAVDRAFRAIGATGRDALDELRRLLHVLGAERDAEEDCQDHDDDESDGQPTLDDLRPLITRCPVTSTLRLRGERTSLPADAETQTYRIVQEALTNVVKHASPDAAARVSVDLGRPGPGRHIRIRVDNSTGSGEPPPALPPSTGRGLAGMRERAALYDGTVTAGRTADGAYRVDAVLWPYGRPARPVTW
ncbi:sensor histidine kinase [Streptomyces sp. AK04-3B]|uniref:sensor histidine kinase n=1 Tax=Streptomyces sp. AK04-3B TaxID=3028650 RepID=UPI0029B73B86|nr:histidine kinase [Streptomyces sp. AK04-3B]MDX3798700.1 histidine kinase [Streptomyces sp. AK04-3B]